MLRSTLDSLVKWFAFSGILCCWCDVSERLCSTGWRLRVGPLRRCRLVVRDFWVSMGGRRCMAGHGLKWGCRCGVLGPAQWCERRGRCAAATRRPPQHVVEPLVAISIIIIVAPGGSNIIPFAGVVVRIIIVVRITVKVATTMRRIAPCVIAAAGRLVVVGPGGMTAAATFRPDDKTLGSTSYASSDRSAAGHSGSLNVIAGVSLPPNSPSAAG